ncbi:MAG: hypothetical protein COA96_18245 [SAR86 cluster bacterium]|uniref:Amidohydrolase-related domain-containing protein n=1 Tax=SAR86 cluster bacterium TaxID=2030880 RepID=A0A2A5ACA5_9GAMM|nr:MAG: hypothetical protein COA96_18245 [SAR86 cluster bacterium]
MTHALAVEEQTGTKILYGVGTEAQARDAVTEIASKGISVIKIWVDDRGGSQEKLSPELYRIIINQAKSHSIQVFVHQQYATDIPDLLDAGVSGFLHGRLGSDLTDSIAQQLASSGAFVVPNLGLGELRREAVGDDLFLQETIPASVARRLSVAAGQRQAATAINAERERQRERELSESFTRLIAADVNVILGTDAGAVPDHFFGYTGHRELEIFVRLGMTPMQALIAATSKPATSLGLQDLGFLKEGFSADLLVLDSNPLDNIRNTRSISRVYLSGKEIDRESMRSRFTN